MKLLAEFSDLLSQIYSDSNLDLRSRSRGAASRGTWVGSRNWSPLFQDLTCLLKKMYRSCTFHYSSAANQNLIKNFGAYVQLSSLSFKNAIELITFGVVKIYFSRDEVA